MLDEFARCVTLFRDYHGAHGELEFRLGTQSEERFGSGVTRDTFEQLERDMTDALQSDRLWTEIVDYYYLNTSGATLRTRVAFDHTDMTLHTEHVRKEVLRTVTVCRDDDPSDACRLSCAVEHPVAQPPASVMINYVRVKQRKRFVDVRDGNEVWAFELSKTWSAGSRDAVEYQQHHTEPHYEVECELVDRAGTYLSERSHDEVAASILLKVKMLLGEDADGRVHVVSDEYRSRRKRSRRMSDCDARAVA